jgi:hypothetical protein
VNEEIVREYRERGLLVEIETGKGTEESWEKLYTVANRIGFPSIHCESFSPAQ